MEKCPKEALVFGKRDELIKIARQRIAQFPDKYVDHIYGEHEMGGTSWMYLSGVPFSQIGMREDLGTTSAPELTAGPLAAVPIVVGLWPVLLGGIYAVSKRNAKVANDERVKAVKDALKRAGEEAEKKLHEELGKAEQASQRRIEVEVKKAVEEALAPKEEDAGTNEEESLDVCRNHCGGEEIPLHPVQSYRNGHSHRRSGGHGDALHRRPGRRHQP